MTGTTHEIRLARQPGDKLLAADFALVEAALPDPAAGEVSVRNLWMSIDPYMRLPLAPQGGLHPAVSPGDTLSGAAIGVVERSESAKLAVGDLVLSNKGWREAFVAPAEMLRHVAQPAPSLSWHVSLLGMTGTTAHAGIEEVLKPLPGETIYISGAAGAVGSVACQLAKLRGARVLGSAGTDEKVRWLINEIGVDAACNYRTGDLKTFLAAEAPGGLHCYFDNVGGATLDAVIRAIAPRGRIGLCGAISQYETANYRRGPDEFFMIIEKGLTVTGFNSSVSLTPADTVAAFISDLMRDGKLVWRETVVEGLAGAPEAFVSLFTGGTTGKLVVKLGELNQ